MERNEIRIQPSNQRNRYKPFCMLFSGLHVSGERLKFRPREQACGPNSSQDDRVPLLHGAFIKV